MSVAAVVSVNAAVPSTVMAVVWVIEPPDVMASLGSREEPLLLLMPPPEAEPAPTSSQLLPFQRRT